MPQPLRADLVRVRVQVRDGEGKGRLELGLASRVRLWLGLGLGLGLADERGDDETGGEIDTCKRVGAQVLSLGRPLEG